MQTKRVLHILPHRGGGAEVYISMLEAAPGYVHERVYLSDGRTPSSALTSLPIRLPAIAQRMRTVDAIHVHGDAAATIVSPFLGKRPSIITTHGLHLLRRTKGAAHAGIRLSLRRSVSGSKAVIATSQSELDELGQYISVADFGKVRVILNGVRTASLISDAERTRIRTGLGIGPGTVLGLFAGDLEARKEPILAAAAAIRVAREGIPFVLAFAGAGSLDAALRAQSGPTVQLLGFRDDLDQLMSAADVFVHPASREGMSLAVLEAMSHGLAVIAADVPGNAEAVATAGLLFDVGDESALAAKIAKLCADAERRKDLAKAARLRSATTFDPGRFVAATMAVYDLAVE